MKRLESTVLALFAAAIAFAAVPVQSANAWAHDKSQNPRSVGHQEAPEPAATLEEQQRQRRRPFRPTFADRAQVVDTWDRLARDARVSRYQFIDVDLDQLGGPDFSPLQAGVSFPRSRRRPIRPC